MSSCLRGHNAVPHDYHVCITQIDHNAKTKSLEITVKLFTDDIERTVRNLGGADLRLGDSHEVPDAEQTLFRYLQNRLEISVNGQARALEWVGKEVDAEAVWCFVEIPGVEKLSTLAVTNRILTELFDDQANPVHVQAHGETKSLYLSKTTLSGQVQY